MRFFRTVGARLSLALLLVVAVALGIVYVTVVPSLKSRLVNGRVSELERAGGSLGRELKQGFPPDVLSEQDFVDNAHANTSARAILFTVYPTSPSPFLLSQADSSGGTSSEDVDSDPIAKKAAETQRSQHGTVERGERRYAEVAVYVPGVRTGNTGGNGAVLLLTDSLQDQLSSVHQVQRRLLLAAGAALVIALLLGYGGAWMFARRIRRLERAAERIAGGHFDEPVRDSGGDELGELAEAFERMRVRLAQLDDARREFVANASHELRTPLFSLAGFLELLDDEVLDETTRREFLDSMREQVTRLTKLASDLLDLSRLDAGRLTVEREPVDLATLAEDLVEEFGPVAHRSEHDLELAEDGPAAALADELRALQIGRILVENALLHTPSGTAVRVSARTRGDRAALEVEDGGPGIPEGQVEQLFERFYRLDGTRASGSGLGLAIASELAELMGGTIEIESEPGRTRFRLWLPSSRAYVPEPPESVAAEVAG
jgi:signal transduction histidine kinase